MTKTNVGGLPHGSYIVTDNNTVISELNKRIAELEKERDEYHAMVVYMGAIMDESEGVAGYHLNGDIAKWDDLFTTSILEDAALIRDLEQQAKGANDFARAHGLQSVIDLAKTNEKVLINQIKLLKEKK